MNSDNPAYYECPKGKNKLHTWSPIIENEINRVGAICLHCNVILTKVQANDVWEEYLCKECLVDLADPPSKLCPVCEAYKALCK